MNYNKIFDTILEMCFSGGGDGDAAIISPNFEELADKFSSYLKNDDSLDFKRSNYLSKGAGDVEYICFYMGQESVYFTNEAGENKVLSTDGKIKLLV